jgi:Putative metallopeptidase
VLTFGAGPVFSQPAPPPSSAPSQSPTPPQVPAPPGKFQDRIDAAARALRENNPRFKGTSPEYVQGLAEFVSGNMLFVLLHEMAHVSITQMGLPVLGRMEDAADTYAALRLIRSGSNFSRRVLTEAAEGWFMADRRDQKAGDKVAYYDDHGLNQQRAYQIVCLMVGFDNEKFKDLAKETKRNVRTAALGITATPGIPGIWCSSRIRVLPISRRRRSMWSMERPRAGLRAPNR